MSTLLPGLTVVVAALLALGPVASVGGDRFAARATPVLCAAGAALALVALLAEPAPALLELPIGLPGSGILLGLDGLSALFLLALFVVATAAAALALAPAPEQPAVPLLPPLTGLIAMATLAADGFSIVLAMCAAALAAAALALPGGRASTRLIGGGMFAGLCLVAAMALLAPLQSWGLDLSFTGMRAHPPEGWRASAVSLLALLAGGGAAGMAPLHRWLPAAQAAMPPPAAALLVGAGGNFGAYLLLRLLLDLVGPAPPAWAGAVILLCGAGGALLGAARTVRATDIRDAAGAVAVTSSGLVGIGFGLALAARAADLGPLAALALGAALLLGLAQALGGTLLALAIAAAEAGGGTRRLGRLGGLLRTMPVTTGCVLVAAFGFAALPTSFGFAAAWTLLQALIGTARANGLGWQALATLATLATTLSMTLGAVGAVRLVGIGFLGRPRTPRAAAAREPTLAARIAMLGLAAATLLAGVVPGAVLRLTEPALRQSLGIGLEGRAGPLAIQPAAGTPGLVAVALAVLLALAILATLRLSRVRAGIGHRAGTAWEGGAAPSPPWLLFGDPATQILPEGFAEPVATLLRVPRLDKPLRAALRFSRRAGIMADRMCVPSARAGLAALGAAAAIAMLALVLAAAA